MGLMLNVTIPIEGFMALRNAIGEERAVVVARALEHAQIQGEAELVAKIYAQSEASLKATQQALQEQIAQLPNREELKRFATHEDLSDLRSHVLRLDKKMTVGFLTLLGLNLASSAPTFFEWGIKVVGYALR
ncbi:hypothetical protein [Achromobacter marplatensis]|uniref:Uncharacterized protein n=1 Tax=Achromobacter marplatensis TaxID=470868 RepID=A0AA42WI61_9BURK|nr:hypothetical protein [Achromobacter marplatensis]MDH2054292.1 hypothetical protein [Achromobacter marplatensis]